MDCIEEIEDKLRCSRCWANHPFTSVIHCCNSKIPGGLYLCEPCHKVLHPCHCKIQKERTQNICGICHQSVAFLACPLCPGLKSGITLDVGNRYSQTVERSFHISMAAIDPSTVGKGENVSIMLQIEKAEFLLCTLNPGYLQQQLDLNFTEGEEVTFFLKGKGVVHLTGYLVPEEEEYPADMSSMEGEDEEEEESEEEEDEDDSEEDDDEAPELLAMEEYLANGKRKKGQDQDPAVKRMKFDEQEFDSEDEDDEDFSTLNFEEDSDEEGEEDDDEEDDDEDDEDDEDEEDDEDDDDEDDEEDEEEEDLGDSFVQMEAQQKSKKSKAAESPKKQINGVHTSPGKQKTPKGNLTVKEEKKTPKEDKNMKIKQEKTTPKAEKSPKAQKQKTPKEGKTPKDQKTPQESKSPKGQGKGVKKVLAGGVTLEEVKEGHGPEARQGKMVHVYYSGKLDSGKKFDSCVIGKPFKFKLGKGEVVKGWDVGLQGMKVGGKRKLTIPPSFGYGSRKMGPIPANSTLVFDIELKAVS